MSASEVIKVEGLTKFFGPVKAVQDLNFHVHRGEAVGLLGPNGAGKTTTLHMLLGLLKPTSGEIRILGRDLARDRIHILQRVNFSSAYASLPSNLTVWENLYVFAGLYGQNRPEERIRSLLELFELTAQAERLTGALSSGQQTRLNLAKAFLNEPEILFLDEPTASLDPDIGDRVRRILKQIQRERRVTLVYTSHNMHEVERMCDRVLFLARGRLIAQGSPREILQAARSRSLEDVFIRVARDGFLREPGEEGRSLS